MNPDLLLLKVGKNILFQDHLEEIFPFPLPKATELLSILLMHRQTLKHGAHESKFTYFLFGPLITVKIDTSANVNY